MKIALIYDAVYPWVKGGGEKQLWELARTLHQRGHEVHCFGMQFWAGARSIEQEGVWLHGVCRARNLYDAKGKRARTQPLVFGCSVLRAFLRKEAGAFDVVDVIAFPYFAVLALACARAVRRHRWPLLVTWLEIWGPRYWREYLGSGLMARIGAAIERLCAKAADHHLCISRHQASRLRVVLDVPEKKIDVVPRGVRVAASGMQQHPGRILYLGRLIDYKNTGTVINAMPALVERFPGASLRIVGSGPDSGRLLDLARSSSAASAIEFLPPHGDSTDALREIETASILVQPSTREGQSLVVIEAQALGVPVVAARHDESAVTDFIDSGRTGLLVERWNDPGAWSEAIGSLLADEAARTRIAGAARECARDYDWSKTVGPRMEELYLRLATR